MYTPKIAAIMPANMEVEFYYQDRRVLYISTIPPVGMIEREGPDPPVLQVSPVQEDPDRKEATPQIEEDPCEAYLRERFDRRNKKQERPLEEREGS